MKGTDEDGVASIETSLVGWCCYRVMVYLLRVRLSVAPGRRCPYQGGHPNIADPTEG